MSLADVNWDILRVSGLLTLLATTLCVLIGTPIAWRIARSRPAVANVLSTFALLPLVLPPTAVGYYVLFILGRQSAIGRFLIDDLGIRLIFTWPGAAIGAAIVTFPLYVRTAQAGFEQIDPDLLAVARTMASPRRVFWSVAIPLAWPSLVAATVIAIARTFGEFGAAVIIAGNIPGETQTLPSAIYDATQAGNPALANALAAVAVVIGVVLLSILALVLHRAQRTRRI